MLKHYKNVAREIKTSTNNLTGDIIDELNNKFNYDFDISVEDGELPIINLDSVGILDGCIVGIRNIYNYISIDIETDYDVIENIELHRTNFSDVNAYIELYEYMINNIREEL